MSVQSEPYYVRLESGPPAKMASQLPYYPIHHSVKDLLHREYVDFYNKYLINCQQAHLQPISVTRGNKGNFGGSAPLPVGGTRDFLIKRRESVGPDVRIRCFTPSGHPPESGWPVMLYYHGGGWVLGDIDSENNICTHMCMRARCVVITTDYRLAPEHPFPAAIHDAWEALLWTFIEGTNELTLNPSKIALGGSSAGANLAAAITNKATVYNTPINIVSQLLVVPVLDNTAFPSNNPTYRCYEYTASLSAEKMIWYRNHYLPNPVDCKNPDASPLLFLTTPSKSNCSTQEPSENTITRYRDISRLPPTLIIVGGCDILRHEGEVYGRILQDHGVAVQFHVMQGMPHPFLALDAVLEAGRRAIALLCDELNRVFADK